LSPLEKIYGHESGLKVDNSEFHNFFSRIRVFFEDFPDLEILSSQDFPARDVQIVFMDNWCTL